MAHSPRILSAFAALALLASVSTGCKEDDNRLFDESGVWSLTHYSLDGTNLNEVNGNTQTNAFMLNFNASKGVVAAAACANDGGSVRPNDSTCRLAPSADKRDWECSCFSYEFDESTMRWTRFQPGETPPPVGSGSSDTDGDSGTDTVLVAEYPDVASSYFFEPLPGPSPTDTDGLFASDGTTSRYVFLKRFEGLFDETGCAAACFGE